MLLAEGRTALYLAAREGHYGVTQTLLDERANPNSRDKHDETPLMAAAENKKADIVELLLKFDADVNLRTVGGKRALHGAAVVGAPDSLQLITFQAQKK